MADRQKTIKKNARRPKKTIRMERTNRYDSKGPFRKPRVWRQFSRLDENYTR